MTLVKSELKALKAEGSKLTKKVINMLLDQGTPEEIENYMKDVLQHGCVSGMVSELIYYRDTLDFFKKYRKDIVSLLNESLDQTGYTSPAELFGEKWDNDDPLAEEENNINLLSWFAFEETVYRIANELELDI